MLPRKVTITVPSATKIVKPKLEPKVAPVAATNAVLNQRDKGADKKSPTPRRASKGLSLAALLKSTPPYYRAKVESDEVTVKTFKPAKTKGGLPAMVGTVSSLVHRPRSRRTYKVSVIGLDPDVKRLYRQAKVLVSCNCSSYLYTWEFANWTWGASKIIYGNGEPATQTNRSNVPGLCVAKDQLVYTNRGLLVIQDVQVGDKVSTLRGMREVLSAAQTGSKKVVEVKTATGKAIRITPEHQVLAIRNQLPKWVEAKNLKEDDLLVCKLNSDFSTEASITEAEARLLGYLTAEWFKGRFWNENPSILNDFVRVATTIDANGIVAKGVGSVVISEKLIDWAMQHGLKSSSSKKRIPKIIYTQPKEIIQHFLQAMWEGDGCFTELTCAIGSRSLLLMQDVQVLLGAFGILGSITKNTLREGTKHYTTMWLLRISDSISKKRLAELLGDLLKYKLPNIADATGTGTGSRRGIFPINLMGLLARDVERNVKRTETKSTAIVTVHDYAATSMANVTSHAVRAALGKKALDIRTRTGGKPNKAGRIVDIERGLRSYRVKRILASIQGHVGWTNIRSRSFLSKKTALRFLSRLDLTEYSRFERKIKQLTNPDVTFERAVSVTHQEKVEVYDLTIQGAEHFTVNSVVVHNCKHLVAFVRTIRDEKR